MDMPQYQVYVLQKTVFFVNCVNLGSDNSAHDVDNLDPNKSHQSRLYRDRHGNMSHKSIWSFGWEVPLNMGLLGHSITYVEKS